MSINGNRILTTLDYKNLRKENVKLKTQIEKISEVQNMIITTLEKAHPKFIFEFKRKMDCNHLDKNKKQKLGKKQDDKLEVKTEKTPMAKVNVSSMDELNNKFEEFNKNNKSGLITYGANELMVEMLNKSFKIVRRCGTFNEEGLIGLEPPERLKGTLDWQSGCWFFPDTCIQEL